MTSIHLRDLREETSRPRCVASLDKSLDLSCSESLTATTSRFDRPNSAFLHYPFSILRVSHSSILSLSSKLEKKGGEQTKLIRLKSLKQRQQQQALLLSSRAPRPRRPRCSTAGSTTCTSTRRRSARRTRTAAAAAAARTPPRTRRQAAVAPAAIAPSTRLRRSPAQRSRPPRSRNATV